MQALERGFISNDWIIAILLVALLLLFVLKIINSNRLFGYAFSFFLKGFIEKRTEENPSYFSLFHAILFVFSIVISSLFIVELSSNFLSIKTDGFMFFWQVFLFIFTTRQPFAHFMYSIHIQ